MSLDNTLFWVAFGIVMVGEVMSFSRRWWAPSYMVLALGLAVLAAGSLVRGHWPWDFAMAALCAVSGLGIIYLALRKEKQHAREQVVEGQGDGVVPEGSGDSAQ